MSQLIEGAESAACLEPADPGMREPGAGATEARRHARARARWPIRLIGPGGAVASGWVCDVSEGGLGLISDLNLPTGTILDTAIAIPHPKAVRRSLAIQAKVRVVFSAFVGTQSRLGVQFLALPMEARIAIRNYVIANSR